MNDLLRALPPRYAASGQITLLLQTLAAELVRLEQAVQAAAARGLLEEADEAGLYRWEEDLGLSHRPDLDTEGRRSILLAALNRAYDGTAAGMTAYAETLTGAPVAVSQDPASRIVTLTTGDTCKVDFYSLQHWVRRRLPAHVTGTFIRSAE